MESFFRYISYIDLYDKHNKIRNVGFLRWKYQDEKHKIELQIKDANNLCGNFMIKETKSQKFLGNIRLEKGIGSFIHQFSSCYLSDSLCLNTENNPLPLNEFKGLSIAVDNNHYLFVPVNLPLEKKENYPTSSFENSDIKKQTEIVSPKTVTEEFSKESISTPNSSAEIKTNTSVSSKENTHTKTLENTTFEETLKIIKPLHEDKWEQLHQKYPKVHPFPNKITFLSIKPEDFIIFQKNYQKLVHNSFLLHGFYNYGHLILGKLSEDETAPFYLGVPGVYYDREKQAAQMFGFIGFESTEQPVQAGSYGYYMIEVMI